MICPVSIATERPPMRVQGITLVFLCSPFLLTRAQDLPTNVQGVDKSRLSVNHIHFSAALAFDSCAISNAGGSSHKPAVWATDRIVVGSFCTVAIAKSARRTTASPCSTKYPIICGFGAGVRCRPRNVRRWEVGKALCCLLSCGRSIVCMICIRYNSSGRGKTR